MLLGAEFFEVNMDTSAAKAEANGVELIRRRWHNIAGSLHTHLSRMPEQILQEPWDALVSILSRNVSF